MNRIFLDKMKRQLNAAKGYLQLNLPLRSLEILEGRNDWTAMQFEASSLHGEALRVLDRYKEAIPHLEIASRFRPNDLGVAFGLGWCYKRTHKLAQAIDAVERALEHHPNQALLRFNLACYWNLAGRPSKALQELAEALKLDPTLRADIPDEPDFHSLRDDPIFQELTVRPSQSA